MATSIAEMVAAASAQVGSNNPATPAGETPPAGESQGITIERQDIQHVEGQAKSGI